MRTNHPPLERVASSKVGHVRTENKDQLRKVKKIGKQGNSFSPLELETWNLVGFYFSESAYNIYNYYNIYYLSLYHKDT